MENLKRIEELLEKGKGKVFEEAYGQVIRDSFNSLMTDTEAADENVILEMIDILEAVITAALTTEDQAKIASHLMIRLTAAKYMTIGHANILLTTISLTFRRGNEILYNVSKYNSHINNICVENMNTLAKLANNRRNEIYQTDVKVVTNLIRNQITTL